MHTQPPREWMKQGGHDVKEPYLGSWADFPPPRCSHREVVITQPLVHSTIMPSKGADSSGQQRQEAAASHTHTHTHTPVQITVTCGLPVADRCTRSAAQPITEREPSLPAPRAAQMSRPGSCDVTALQPAVWCRLWSFHSPHGVWAKMGWINHVFRPCYCIWVR